MASETYRRPALLSGAMPWILCFAALLVLTRVVSLQFEVIDWDEGTYISRASTIARGGFSQIDLFALRPPGFVGALALVLHFFGDSLVAVRAFGTVSLFALSIITFAVCRRMMPVQAAGVAVLVMICAAAAPPFQPAITESFSSTLVMGALFLILRNRATLHSAWWAGFLMSVAALTRLNVLYTVMALGLYYASALVWPRIGVARPAVFAYVAGGIFPLIILLGVYWMAGGIDNFFLFVFGIPLGYAYDQQPIGAVLLTHFEHWLGFAYDLGYIFLPFSLLFVLGFIRAVLLRTEASPPMARGRVRDFLDRDLFIINLFFLSILASIVTGGAAYRHYWLQLFPFWALFAGYVLSDDNELWVRLLSRSLAMIAIVASILQFAPGGYVVISNWSRLTDRYPNYQAASLIAADRRASDLVYALDSPLIYWYLRQDPIVPTVSHPADITNPAIMNVLVAANHASSDELGRILQLAPRYIVKNEGPVWYLHNTPGAAVLAKILDQKYELWKSIGSVEIYRTR